LFHRDITEKTLSVEYSLAYDIRDEFAHVTCNTNPTVASASVVFFHTYEIVEIVETSTDSILFEKQNYR